MKEILCIWRRTHRKKWSDKFLRAHRRKMNENYVEKHLFEIIVFKLGATKSSAANWKLKIGLKIYCFSISLQKSSFWIMNFSWLEDFLKLRKFGCLLWILDVVRIKISKELNFGAILRRKYSRLSSFPSKDAIKCVTISTISRTYGFQ